MPQLRSRLRPLSGPALGLVLLAPVVLFITASILKYAVGLSSLYNGLGFFADPQQLPWYDRISPVLFLGGPLLAAALSLGTIIRLDVRRETDRVVTVVTLTPRFLNLAVAVMSFIILAALIGYVMAESLGQA
jgi:hypothetical protein